MRQTLINKWQSTNSKLILFFLFTCKPNLRCTKFLCSFTTWVRVKMTLYQNDWFQFQPYSLLRVAASLRPVWWFSGQKKGCAAWCLLFVLIMLPVNAGVDAGGVHPPPWDDHQFSNTTGILQKKNFVVYWCWSRARDECTPS